MTYMHFNVFPADSLGWLCRALNTRDNDCDSLVHISGKHLRRRTPATPPYARSNLLARARSKEGNQSIMTELGWQEGGERAEKEEKR